MAVSHLFTDLKGEPPRGGARSTLKQIWSTPWPPSCAPSRHCPPPGHIGWRVVHSSPTTNAIVEEVEEMRNVCPLPERGNHWCGSWESYQAEVAQGSSTCIHLRWAIAQPHRIHRLVTGMARSHCVNTNHYARSLHCCQSTHTHATLPPPGGSSHRPRIGEPLGYHPHEVKSPKWSSKRGLGRLPL